MRCRLLRTTAIALTLACCGFATHVATSSAAETMRLVDPITDNYKASYASTPGVVEKRTFLSMRAIAAGGTTWTPTLPATSIDTESNADGTVILNGADGRTATLSATVDSGTMASPVIMRVDPAINPSTGATDGRFGVLGTLVNRSALALSPVFLNMTLTSDGTVIATGAARYLAEPSLWKVPTSNIEYHGPMGRWYVGNVPLRYDWTPAPASTAGITASSPTIRAPSIIRASLPGLTSSRRAPLTLLVGAGSAPVVAQRVRFDRGRYSGWMLVTVPYRSSVILPRTCGAHNITLQIRGADGGISAPLTRRVTLSC